jgi:hypothetical protein
MRGTTVAEHKTVMSRLKHARGIPEHEVIEGAANREASAADADRLHHARVAELVQHDGRLKIVGCLAHVGLQAANEEWMRLTQRLHERGQRVLR